MARQNRRDIFDPNEVGAFHADQRTVRRAWLCGMDPDSGKSFEHRRTWIQNRLQDLAASFGIDCLAFAIMVNRVHVILRNRPDVVNRFGKIFKRVAGKPESLAQEAILRGQSGYRTGGSPQPA